MDNKPWGMDQKGFITLMHLSQLAGFLVPYAGLILPVLMWLTNKDSAKEIDDHGKVIMNWMITYLVASVICGILTFIFIGVLGFIVIGIVNFIFIILGAAKANQGVLWPYPFSIQVFK